MYLTWNQERYVEINLRETRQIVKIYLQVDIQEDFSILEIFDDFSITQNAHVAITQIIFERLVELKSSYLIEIISRLLDKQELENKGKD